MTEMTVAVTLPVYEVNRDDSVEACRDRSVTITSHWNIGTWVVVQIGDGLRVTVNASALADAARKASR